MTFENKKIIITLSLFIMIFLIIAGCSNNSNLTGDNRYLVSGTILDNNETAIEEVILQFSCDTVTVKTDFEGNWQRSGLSGTVTITPAKDGYTFSPQNIEVSESYTDKDKINFIGTVNESPELDAIGDKSVNEGDTLSFIVTATDPDGDNVTITVSNKPEEATFNKTSGEFSWNTGSGDAGSYQLTFIASDGISYVNETITITVVDTTSANPEMVDILTGRTTSENGYLTLTYDIEMSKYEVTFDDYIAYCVDQEKSIPDDEGWGQDTRPVINVSWNDAAGFCNWLSEQQDLNKAYEFIFNKWELKDSPENLEGYRLPTENEWEYAARGGADGDVTIYAGNNNIDLVAWYNENSGDQTHPVGSKTGNELGIYDMSGNVYEWTNTQDEDDSYYVIRSGSCKASAYYCKVWVGDKYKSYEESNHKAFVLQELNHRER